MNTQDDSVFFLRSKRDQYIVEIRKKKNDEFLRVKRTKLTQGSSDHQSQASCSTRGSVNRSEAQKEFDDLAISFSNALKSEDYDFISGVAECIRLAISQDENPSLEEFTNTGLVVCLVKLLDPQYYMYEKLMTEVTWILANVASGPPVYEDYLISLDIIPKAMDLLGHCSLEVRENVVWLIANIIGETKENKDLLLEKGIVQKIVQILRENDLTVSFYAQIAWLISNICGGKFIANFEQVSPFLPTLQYFLMNFDNDEIVSSSLWALSHLSNTGPDGIQQILDLNVTEKILELLNSKNLRMRSPALRTVGNLLTGENEQIDVLLQNGAIGALAPLLDSSNRMIKREAAWAISNILAGDPTQISQVFKFRNGLILKKLFQLIDNTDRDVARECVFCITNICLSGSLEQIVELIRTYKMLEVLIDMLWVKDEVKQLKASLEALEAVLKIFNEQSNLGNFEMDKLMEKIAECNGYVAIEELQTHRDNEVYGIVATLIENYFDTE